MLRFRLLVGCLFAALCVSATHAATYYIAPGGNDANAGTLSAPWKTLTTSVRKLASGDTLLLRAGTYPGGLYITQTNVTLQAYTGETVVIDGSAAGDDIYFEYTASGCVLRNLDCSGGSTYVVMFATNHTDPANSTGDIGASNILIDNCKLHGSGYIAAKLTQSCNNDTFRGCEVYNEPSLGIDAVASSNLTVEDCYIHDTGGEGVYAKGGSSGVVIQRNRVVNTSSGILLGQSTGYAFFQLNKDPNLYECIDSVARDNIVVNAAYSGIGTYSSLRCAIYNNTIVNPATTGQAGIFVVGATHPDAPAGMTGPVLCSQLQVRNNIVVLASGNTRPHVFLTANSYADRPTFSNNRYFKSGSAAAFWDEQNVIYANFASWIAHIGETGSSEGDPGLDANQHLLATSACIDTGITIASFNFDIDQQTRPLGKAWDIGADEYLPPNVPPVIASAAKATPSSAPTGQAISFTVAATDADGDALTYAWNFGDGTSGSGATASHSYATAGTYTATATISDGHGHSITSSVAVTITVPPPPPPATAIRINSGGAASGTFAKDNSFSGGNTYSTTHAINTSAANAAPAGVYQSERYGNFSYTVGGLAAGTAYTVRLHFAEIYWSSVGRRVFNVAINGQQVLANFDIYAAAGGNFIAVVKNFTATANSSGQIAIAYTTVKDNAKSSGIEVLSQSGATRALTRDTTDDTTTDGPLELTSIDLGSVQAKAMFKTKLDLPETGKAAAKLKFKASNLKQLPAGIRASGPYIGGNPKTPGTYTFQLQFQSGDGQTLVNTYTLTVAP